MEFSSLVRAFVAVLVAAPLAVAQTSARCPILRAKLFAPHPMPSDRFGSSVALDGSTLVVGARRDDYGGLTNPGAVYVYDRVGAAWVLRAFLTPSDAHDGLQFGRVVAVEGDVLLVLSDEAAYAFHRNGPIWTQEARLAGSDAFGDALSLAFQGSTLLIGHPVGPGATSGTGAVYAFERTSAGWVERGKLFAPNGQVGDRFGSSVALDGDRCLIGAEEQVGPSGFQQGAAWVFARTGTTWSPEASVLAIDGNYDDRFGSSVALAGDVALVAAPEHDQLLSNTGAAYVFEKQGTTWVRTAKLTAEILTGQGYFGFALHAREDLLTVTAAHQVGQGFGAGAAYFFERQGTAWNRVARLDGPSPGFSSFFGNSITVQGESVIVSAWSDNQMGIKTGAVYEFLLPEPPTAYCSGKVNSLGCVPFMSAVGVPSETGAAAFELRAEDVLPGASGVLVYGLRGADVNLHGGKQCVKAPMTRLLPATTASSAGGPPCTGVLSTNFNARIQSGADPRLTAGQKIYAQWIQSDPGDPAGVGDSLTDGVTFTVCP